VPAAGAQRGEHRSALAALTRQAGPLPLGFLPPLHLLPAPQVSVPAFQLQEPIGFTEFTPGSALCRDPPPFGLCAGGGPLGEERRWAAESPSLPDDYAGPPAAFLPPRGAVCRRSRLVGCVAGVRASPGTGRDGVRPRAPARLTGRWMLGGLSCTA